MNALYSFDESLRVLHRPDWIVGIDEAGRGPWAGPVVAAAVALKFPFPPHLAGVRDSKKLPGSSRERLFREITRSSLRLGIGWSLPGEIDRLNILQATFFAMRRAFGRLDIDSGKVLTIVDGPYKIPRLDCFQEAVVDGDSLSLSVACASIVAKVIRDRWMLHLERLYPGYQFHRHKGYGTAVHREALDRLGPSPAHRLSFKPVARLRVRAVAI